MKSTTVALGLLAGMASATYNHPRHFHAPRPYYRRDNGTEPSQTTLTVQVTQVHTVTSCAPTVTNCPARNATATGNEAYATIPASDLITSEVTQVVELTTTVCPVAEASSIASSVSAAHSSGLITGTTKDVTATGTSDNSGATASVVTSASVGTTDVPLTYTVGPETAKSVITTTVKSTYTAQVTVTMTKSGSTEASSNSPQDTTSEGTTTTTSTSTGTRTVTISKASTATASGSTATGTSGAEDVTGNSAVGSDAEGSCAEASTVTVTAPASTVYVTVGASGAVGSSTAVATSSAPAATTTESSTSDNSATGSDDEDDSADGDDDESSDDECDADDSSSVVYATATATVVPYPVASGAPNGTYPVPTGAYRMKN